MRRANFLIYAFSVLLIVSHASGSFNRTTLSTVDVYGSPVGISETGIVVDDSETGADSAGQGTSAIQPLAREIGIWDSVSPHNDRLLPFGPLSIGLVRTETIRIRNNHQENNLTIERVHVRPGLVGVEALATASELQVVSGEDSVSGPGNRFPGAPVPDWSQPHEPNTLLVRFNGDTRVEQRLSAHASAGSNVVRAMRRIPLDVVEVPQGADVRTILAAYQRNPSVKYAEPNYVFSIESIPNDLLFDQLWALHNTGQEGGTPGSDISALAAWQWTRGSDEVIVAVIDTGVDYNHPDLAANMWVNPNPTFGDIHGASWTNGNGSVTTADPMDDNGHGTHVAGTIGAVGNNGHGVVGVNWNVRIMALKFLNAEGFGSTADAVSAIEYAIDHGAHVTNNSWSGGGYSQALKDMIAAAGEANQLFIAAAGNDDSDNDSYSVYPASYDLDNIISVASSTRTDDKAYYSNYGVNSVHIAAPGSFILSTVPGGGYSVYSGTSMAAPHVAGVAALVLSLDPFADYRSVKSAILEGVTPLSEWSDLVMSGGRLNAAGALERVAMEFRILNLPAFPVTLGPGRTLLLEVAYQPRGEGAHEAFVVIESQHGESEVHLMGTGLQDPLEIVQDDFDSEGLAGGPFEPLAKIFTLRNNSGESLSWSASTGVSWLAISPSSGSIEPDGEASVIIAIAAAAETLSDGLHSGAVNFANQNTGLSHVRTATLRVLPWPGRLVLTDSIAPQDDLQMPFGWTEPGGENFESITLHNIHEENRLMVEDILLLGGYREDFDKEYLLGWRPQPIGDWSLFGGNSYRAYNPGITGFMHSTYLDEVWLDATFESLVYRQGDTDTSAIMMLRASHDFDIEAGTGSSILIGISGDGHYFIARFVSGNFSWVQPWTFSSFLNVEAVPNLLVASIRDDHLHLFANDELMWSGLAGGIYRPGRFGLAGFTYSDYPTTHHFGYVDVREPLPGEILPLTIEQSWANAHPASVDESFAFLSLAPEFEPPPSEKYERENGISYAMILSNSETFRLPNLPALPFEIPPDGNVTLPVRFAPAGEGDFARTLRIITNDPDSPTLNLSISGSSALDHLRLFPATGIIARGEVGGPFFPDEFVLGLVNTGQANLSWTVSHQPDWITASAASGLIASGSMGEVSFELSEFARNLPTGFHAGTIDILNTDTGFSRTVLVELSIHPLLCKAVKACELTWITGGDAPWWGQDQVTLQSDLAAQSGDIGDDQESWIETTVSGPGTIEFWWMVSSEKGYDFLEFSVNDDIRASISGVVPWTRRSFEIPEGNHTIRWTYFKDFIFSMGQDKGWLDEVVWTPTAPQRVLAVDTELSFGVIRVGESRSRDLTVRNTGDSTLSVSDITLPSGFFATSTSATIPPGGSHDFEVTFAPDAQGHSEGVLQFVSDATGGISEVFMTGWSLPEGVPLELANGQVISGLAAEKGEQLGFFIEVPDDMQWLEVRIFGGSGDGDLYVRHGAMPTRSLWNHAPRLFGNNETVFINMPMGGEWFFMLDAYEKFADVSIIARFPLMEFGAWTAAIGLPPGVSGLFDRHGPLGVTTLEGYAFGRDPRLFTPEDRPRLETLPDSPGQVRLIYRVHTAASDVAVTIEESTNLVDWSPASPIWETVVPEPKGVEIREAIFDKGDIQSFFIRARIDYGE